ncbi:hypothetical protein HL666_11465 [Bradyrhizobium sp. 83002]|nr:hypothetical protein [Bradyrhizobium aeschynomenes]
MMRPAFTSHASCSMQQRAIPYIVVDLLHRYGRSARSHHADVLFFDKAAVRRLTRDMGGPRGLKTIERWLDVYAVIADDGSLITVAHQGRRHHRRR